MEQVITPSTRTCTGAGGMIRTLCIAAMIVSALPAQAESVGPGTESLSSTAAASLFVQVCVKTRPSLAKAKAALAKLGYVAHPETGTFYDNRSDVSFKLLRGEGVCSMVSQSDGDPLEMVMFLALTAGGDDLDVDPDKMIASSTLSDGTEVVAYAAEVDGYFRAFVDNP